MCTKLFKENAQNTGAHPVSRKWILLIKGKIWEVERELGKITFLHKPRNSSSLQSTGDTSIFFFLED